MNIRRVIPDIITVIISFLVILLSFGLGIFYLIVPGAYIQSNTTAQDNIRFRLKNEKDNTYNITYWPTMFGHLIENMAWTVLNPGPNDDISYNDSSAEILFAAYQLLVIIIILNLLIAMMNTTIQKLQDKKLLYWKFARTAIWLEFMGDGIMLPPPLMTISTVLLLLLRVTALVVYGIWWLYRKFSKQRVIGLLELLGKQANWPNSQAHKACKLDPFKWKQRESHATLMEALIKRLSCLDEGSKEMSDLNPVNFQFSPEMGTKMKRLNSTLFNFGAKNESAA